MTRQIGPPRDMGPCCIVWDPDGVNLDMKPTFGTVTYRPEDQKEDVFHDEHGVAPVDSIHTGRPATLEVPMTSPNLAQLEAVIKGSTKKKSAGKYKILWVPNTVGCAVFANAKVIIVKPLCNQVCSAIEAEWLYIFRAYPFAQLEIGFDNNGQRVYNVLFKCYPDDVSGSNNMIYRFGPAS